MHVNLLQVERDHRSLFLEHALLHIQISIHSGYFSLVLEVPHPNFVVILENLIILTVELNLQFLTLVFEELNRILFGDISDVFQFHVMAKFLLLHLFQQILVLDCFCHINIFSLILIPNLSRPFLFIIFI